MTEADLAAMSADEHEDLLRQYLSAYFINKRGGHTEALLFTTRQMLSLISFGKIPRARFLEITKEEWKLNEVLHQGLLALFASGVPNFP